MQMDNKQNKQKEIIIIVNAREKKWPKEEITFDEVVELAFGSISADPNVVYSVTYKMHGKEGALVKGGSVIVLNGTIFNVTQTNKS